MDLIPSRAPSNFPPNFNVCPTDLVDAVVQTERGRELIPMRWGLVPQWWKKPLKELKVASFNARAETVAETPETILRKWRVSKRINSSRAEKTDSTLVDRIEGIQQ